jgi:histidinol-phosphatase (PHP family)
METQSVPDYHTHNRLCRHAEGEPIDYARAAQQSGLPEIGISDHSPMPKVLDDWRMLLEEFPEYLEMVDVARAALPEFPVRLGLEVDYIAGHEPWIEKLSGMAEWDFLIGAVHYIAPGWDFDNPKHLSRWSESDVATIWEEYWKTYTACVASGHFDFYAHPDLAKKFGFRPDGDLKRYYEPAIQAAVDTGAAFEINTAGRYKQVKEFYPAMEFLQLMAEAELPVLISSDAHEPGHVGRDFEDALALAKSAELTKTLRFEKRQRRVVPLP